MFLSENYSKNIEVMNDNIATNDSDEKDKRKRVRLSSDKTTYLQRYFDVKQRPSTGDKREIAKFLGMSFRSVQIWFQNRRAKHKKDMADISNSLSYTKYYNNNMMNGNAKCFASNNSLFTPRDNYLQNSRPFDQKYMYEGHMSRSNSYKGDAYNVNYKPGQDIDFNTYQSPMVGQTTKFFKFHDCTIDKAFTYPAKKEVEPVPKYYGGMAMGRPDDFSYSNYSSQDFRGMYMDDSLTPDESSGAEGH